MLRLPDFLKHRKNKIFLSVLVFLGISGLASLFTFSQHRHEDDVYNQYFKDHYRVFSVKIPDNLEFAGEAVPLNDFEVRERIDREFLINTYWQSQTMLLAKRAGRWLPIIEPILRRYKIPADFKFIPLIESGLAAGVSSRGAAGFWQFVPSTAKEYGLTVNEEIDERYHVIKATEAACKFFTEAYRVFNNWTLVAASYNYGISGISKQLERQGASSYYDLVLNEETARYVFRILAVKEILSHPQDYGFQIRKKDLYPPVPFRIIRVDSSIADLVAFSRKNGITYKLLKYFNGWLRTEKLNNPDGQKFQIIMPDTTARNYKSLLRQLESEPAIPELLPDSL